MRTQLSHSSSRAHSSTARYIVNSRMEDPHLPFKDIKGILLDISGVLRDGDNVIPGSLESFLKLKEHFPIRLVTNESQVSLDTSVEKLVRLGFPVTRDDILAPAPVMAGILRSEGLRPYLLTHPNVHSEFVKLDQTNPNCLVIGDSAQFFTYEALNNAFRCVVNLQDQHFTPRIFTLGRGRYYKEPDGLCLDVGPFTCALEYATNLTAELIGKPSPLIFQAAVKDMELENYEVVMIGDDIVGDVGGAQAADIRGILVRTGKFRPSDENHPEIKPDAIVADLREAVNLIIPKRPGIPSASAGRANDESESDGFVGTGVYAAEEIEMMAESVEEMSESAGEMSESSGVIKMDENTGVIMKTKSTTETPMVSTNETLGVNSTEIPVVTLFTRPPRPRVMPTETPVVTIFKEPPGAIATENPGVIVIRGAELTTETAAVVMRDTPAVMNEGGGVGTEEAAVAVAASQSADKSTSKTTDE